MLTALLLAEFSLPTNPLFWLGVAGLLYLVFAPWGESNATLASAIAPAELLPFEPPAKLQPKTKAIDQLHAVGDYLDSQGRTAEAAAHLEALAVLINRRG